jgi:hypothetical protein
LVALSLQTRSMRLCEMAEATRLPGAVGADGVAGVVALATFDAGESPPMLVAMTR